MRGQCQFRDGEFERDEQTVDPDARSEKERETREGKTRFESVGGGERDSTESTSGRRRAAIHSFSPALIN